MRNLGAAAIAAGLGLFLIGSKANAQNINVVINGTPVSFIGAPPQEVNGSVLVPLRGVFEQLGAQVQYNPTSRTIFAAKGSTTVSLSLGSNTAYVDNQEEQLAQPPTVMTGTTLVPLRFVAEAFGAYVEWQPQTSTVQIQTTQSAAVPESPAAPPPPQDHHADDNHISGRIDSVDNPGNAGQITIDTSNGPVQANVNDRTKIVEHRSDATEPTPADVRDLQVGDRVSAVLGNDGDARFIDITDRPRPLATVSGRVSQVEDQGPNTQVVLQSDSGSTTITIDDHTNISEDESNQPPHPAQSGDIREGDMVTAKTWPNGNAQSVQITVNERRGTILTVQNLPNGSRLLIFDNGKTVILDRQAQILMHGHPADRSLQPGDSVRVRLGQDGDRGYSVEIE